MTDTTFKYQSIRNTYIEVVVWIGGWWGKIDVKLKKGEMKNTFYVKKTINIWCLHLFSVDSYYWLQSLFVDQNIFLVVLFILIFHIMFMYGYCIHIVYSWSLSLFRLLMGWIRFYEDEAKIDCIGSPNIVRVQDALIVWQLISIPYGV